jgi:hypothetical protein
MADGGASTGRATWTKTTWGAACARGCLTRALTDRASRPRSTSPASAPCATECVSGSGTHLPDGGTATLSSTVARSALAAHVTDEAKTATARALLAEAVSALAGAANNVESSSQLRCWATALVAEALVAIESAASVAEEV